MTEGSAAGTEGEGAGTEGTAAGTEGEGAGERSGPWVIWSPAYELDLGRHVYPTSKYRLVRKRLLEEGTLEEGDFEEPEAASWDDLARVHTPGYLEKVRRGELSFTEERILEVPFSQELRHAMILCCGGTAQTARRATRRSVAVHLGGGFHHAFADHGEGFCLLNDVAVATTGLLEEGRAERVAVVDLDVHHGNGTAAIFADDPRVFTFSMHQERNYPFPKPPGDLDVGLEDGTRDETYLGLLEERLEEVLVNHAPDLVFYLAGADPFREDQLGGLSLSLQGLLTRDRFVLSACRERGIPVAVTLAGGYAFRLEDTVEIHCGTVRAAADLSS